MLGRESARRWLVSQGKGAADLPPDVLDRLREMAADAATPKTQLFPAHTKMVAAAAGSLGNRVRSRIPRESRGMAIPRSSNATPALNMP